MKKIILLLFALIFLFGCESRDETTTSETPESTVGVIVEYTEPEALEVPETKTPSSDEDWEAMVHNKNIEIIQVLNIINPVAAYLTAGFEQYGEGIDNETVHGEWEDTQVQLGKALDLYNACNAKIEKGEFNKKLFLDMEGVWQLLVKTGVAGIRTKQMLDAELKTLS